MPSWKSAEAKSNSPPLGERMDSDLTHTVEPLAGVQSAVPSGLIVGPERLGAVDLRSLTHSATGVGSATSRRRGAWSAVQVKRVLERQHI